MISILLALCLCTEEPKFHIPKEVEQAAKKGLDFLVRCQKSDGTIYATYEHRKIVNAAFAGLAFLSQGSNPREGEYSKAIDKCVKSILATSNRNNGLLAFDMKYGSQMYEHAFCLLFLSEVYGQHKAEDNHLKVRISKAIDIIVGAQDRKAGGWRYSIPSTDSDVSVTVAQIMALRSCKSAGFKIPDHTIERAKNYLLRCQQPDGSFRYTEDLHSVFDTGAVRTAAALTALFNIGLYEGQEIDKAFKHLNKYHPAKRSICGTATNYYTYGNYYSAAAAKQIGDKFWQEWYLALSRQIMKYQIDDHWRINQYDDAALDTALICIVLYMPNDFLPIFQD
jgi:hypothetical protein